MKTTFYRSPIFLLLLLPLVLLGYYLTRPIGQDAQMNEVLLHSVWIPTALMSCLMGALLANSGLLVQATLDNGFASPATLGIASGALLGATLAKLLVPNASLHQIWLGALLGGAILATIVIAISHQLKGGKLAIILIGMTLGLTAGAIASSLILFFEHETDGLFLWGSGQVLQTGPDDLFQSAPISVALCLISLVFLPKLGLLSLGDNHANTLGLNASYWRNAILLLAVLQASLVISLVGMIGFVGLIAPHIARYCMPISHGNRYNTHWLLSLLLGALIVLLAEWASRSLLFIGYRLPTGAMSALVGTPFILVLLLKNKADLITSQEQQALSLKPIITLSTRWSLVIIGVFFLTTVAFWLASDEQAQWSNYRVVVAMLAGASLALAGCLLQNLFKNPMASPDTIGVSGGAILAISCLLMFWPDATTLAINTACFIGALLIVALLGWGIKSQYSIAHIALFGLAISAFTGTLVQIILTFGTTTSTTTLMWISGTTYSVDNSHAAYISAVLAVALILLIPLLKTLDILPMGERTPKLLGINIQKSQLTILILCTLLTTASVSSVGAISFVGLVAPHVARLIGIYKHTLLIPAAAMIGGTLLIWADGLGRSVIAPNEIPSGLLVSVIGGTYFMGLILLGYRR